MYEPSMRHRPLHHQQPHNPAAAAAAAAATAAASAARPIPAARYDIFILPPSYVLISQYDIFTFK